MPSAVMPSDAECCDVIWCRGSCYHVMLVAVCCRSCTIFSSLAQHVRLRRARGDRVSLIEHSCYMLPLISCALSRTTKAIKKQFLLLSICAMLPCTLCGPLATQPKIQKYVGTTLVWFWFEAAGCRSIEDNIQGGWVLFGCRLPQHWG